MSNEARTLMELLFIRCLSYSLPQKAEEPVFGLPSVVPSAGRRWKSLFKSAFGLGQNNRCLAPPTGFEPVLPG